MAIGWAKRPDTHEVAPKRSAHECLHLAPRAGVLRSGPYRTERPDRSGYTPRTDSRVGGDGLTTPPPQIDHRRDIQMTSPGFAEDSIRRQA